MVMDSIVDVGVQYNGLNAQLPEWRDIDMIKA